MDEQRRRRAERAGTRHGKVRKPLSCWPCRQRKLKCDRGLPACSNCVHRGQIVACSYASRSPVSRGRPLQSSPDLSETAQRKLDRLERLVTTLVNQQRTNDQVGTLSGSNTNNRGAHVGQVGNYIDVEPNNQNFNPASGTRSQNVVNLCTNDNEPRLSVDEARWASVLREIHDVRTYLSAQHKRHEEQAKAISSLLQRTSEDSGPTLLFGSTGNMDKLSIISQLPSRYFCDIIIARFFSNLYPLLHFIHRPTFEAQYEEFWTNTRNVSIVWVSLLFAMLRIAMLDYIREGDEPVEWSGKCQDLAINFRRCFTDCLILADYLQPHEFLIEALILHQYAEYVSSRDARSSGWVLIGMIIRLAMRMGYHQPSQPTLDLTPFKAEMRKRAWAFIRQADIMVSWQMGLPSMTDLSANDDALPRNIYDDESFHEKCVELPTALPDSEPTQISYLIAKTKLVFGFARAIREINRAPSVKWEKVVEIEQELRRTYDNVPDHFKLDRLSGEHPLVLASARFSLACIHYKSLCVIHSGFLDLARADHRYKYSSRICLGSAMSILRLQAIQDQEIPVGGGTRRLTNYQTSLTNHHYLLAAVIICTHLSSTSNATTSSHPGAPSSGTPTRIEMIKALKISAQIFSQMRDQSSDACKAADVLEMLVKKFEVEDCAEGTYEIAEGRQTTDSSSAEQDRPAPNLNSGLPHRQTALETSQISAPFITASSPIPDTIPKSNAITSIHSKDQAHDLACDSSARINADDQVKTVLHPVLEGTDLEMLSIWPEMHQRGITEHEFPFPADTFPELGTSAALDTQRLSSGQSSFGNSIPSWRTANPSSSSLSTLAVNNPLYTLWSLNAGTEDDALTL